MCVPKDLIACLKRPQDHEHDWRLIFADAARACELANARIKELQNGGYRARTKP